MAEIDGTCVRPHEKSFCQTLTSWPSMLLSSWLNRFFQSTLSPQLCQPSLFRSCPRSHQHFNRTISSGRLISSKMYCRSFSIAMVGERSPMYVSIRVTQRCPLKYTASSSSLQVHCSRKWPWTCHVSFNLSKCCGCLLLVATTWSFKILSFKFSPFFQIFLVRARKRWRSFFPKWAFRTSSSSLTESIGTLCLLWISWIQKFPKLSKLWVSSSAFLMWRLKQSTMLQQMTYSAMVSIIKIKDLWT